MKKTPTASNRSNYNVTIWRIQGGKVLSVGVGLVAGTKLVRSNGLSCTGVDGTAAYHDRYLAQASEFGGLPCDVILTDSVDGFIKAACSGSEERERVYRKERSRGAIQISAT